MEEQWWSGGLAADIHETLRMKELQLPMYEARSPQIGMRRYFVEFLTVCSKHFDLCPTAQHLAIYLLDILMDRYDIPVKHLHIISLVCLLLANSENVVKQIACVSCICYATHAKAQEDHLPNGKFEGKEVKIPRLAELNYLAYLCNVDVVLNKEELFRLEILLLENFNWNLCLPTPAHYIDYYLCASLGKNDCHSGWPIASPAKFRPVLEKYAHYFLHLSVQDHTFCYFRPSLIAAACVCASRICLQISPAWTTELELLTCYSWEQLAQCVEILLIYYENDIKEASNINQQVTMQHQEQEAVRNVSYQATAQVLFQQSSYYPAAQHSSGFSQFQSPMQDVCSAYRHSLQAHRPSALPAGGANGSLHSCRAAQASLWPSAHAQAIQTPIAVQVALGTAPTHCISTAYGSSYFSNHHLYAAGYCHGY